MAIDQNKIPDTNEEWAAQQMLLHFTKGELKQLRRTFEKLNEALYKSWAKQMTLEELNQAIEMQ